MAPRVLYVPYCVGREAQGMGAGPLALSEAARTALAPDDVRRISLTDPWTTEVGACFALNRQLAHEVAVARADGVLPVVLTGNCHSQQAVVAGLGSDGLGLVWLDCHGDFNTPETTETGYFDGYGLAMVVGDCWRTLCGRVPGFIPLEQDRVLLAGVRDLEAGERERLEQSKINRVDSRDIGALAGRFECLRAERMSLHIDLDVLDPAYGRANAYAVPGGITPDELIGTVRAVARQCSLAAVTLSAYDPGYDEDGRVREVALAILHEIRG